MCIQSNPIIFMIAYIKSPPVSAVMQEINFLEVTRKLILQISNPC